MMLTFHMGRFLPRGRQRSRNFYTHPSRPLRLSWCSWEKTKWVKKWRKRKEDRRQDKQQVSSECIDRHTTLNQQNTLSPAVTSQFSEMPAAKRGQSSGSSSRQNMNKLLFPVLVFTHFTACQTQPNVDVHLVMFQNLCRILICSTVTKRNLSAGNIVIDPQRLSISLIEHWRRLSFTKNPNA